MGWFGYGIYDGDETQTCHLDFLKIAGSKIKETEMIESFFKTKKTLLDKETKNLVIGLMPVYKSKAPKSIKRLQVLK